MDYVGLQIEVDKRLFTNVHCIYIVFRFSKEEDKMFDDVAYYLISETEKRKHNVLFVSKNMETKVIYEDVQGRTEEWNCVRKHYEGKLA